VSPVCGGLFAIRIAALVVGIVVQYVPDGNEQLARLLTIVFFIIVYPFVLWG